MRKKRTLLGPYSNERFSFRKEITMCLRVRMYFAKETFQIKYHFYCLQKVLFAVATDHIEWVHQATVVFYRYAVLLKVGIINLCPQNYQFMPGFLCASEKKGWLNYLAFWEYHRAQKQLKEISVAMSDVNVSFAKVSSFVPFNCRSWTWYDVFRPSASSHWCFQLPSLSLTVSNFFPAQDILQSMSCQLG